MTNDKIKTELQKINDAFSEKVATIKTESWYLNNITDVSPRQKASLDKIENAIEDLFQIYLKNNIDLYPSKKRELIEAE